MAAGLLPAQAAMKWLVVLSAEAGRRKAWGAAGFFVSLASFDYQRLRAECLWHQACSWKRPSGCEWDDSGRNVTQKYLGYASHPAGVKGKAPISKMSAFKALRETVLCGFFSVYPQRSWEGYSNAEVISFSRGDCNSSAAMSNWLRRLVLIQDKSCGSLLILLIILHTYCPKRRFWMK